MNWCLHYLRRQFNSFALMPVRFFKEGVTTRISNRQKLVETIGFLGIVEEKQIGDINIVLVSDKRLLEMNRQYLQHDYYTDIITFQHPTPPASISGDLYISVDRITDNSEKLKVTFLDELTRVIIHGVLHLCGYRDKQAVDIKLMRKKEDFYLESLKKL